MLIWIRSIAQSLMRSVARSALAAFRWPLRPIGREEAQQIVENALPKDCVVLRDHTEEFPMLWVFYYTTHMIGPGPMTVHRQTGALRRFGSGPMEWDRLVNYERRTRLGFSFRRAFEFQMARYQDGNLVRAEAPTLKAQIGRQSFLGPDPWGYYRVKLSDGTAFEIAPTARDSEPGVVRVRVWKKSVAIASFVHEAAVANDLVVEVLSQPGLVFRQKIIFFKAEQGLHLERHVNRTLFTGSPKLCTSPQNLRALLFE
jgi:hypothetical protein